MTKRPVGALFKPPPVGSTVYFVYEGGNVNKDIFHEGWTDASLDDWNMPGPSYRFSRDFAFTNYFHAYAYSLKRRKS